MITTQVIGSVGVSTSRQFIGAAFRIFNQPIQKLFENGEQGFFYDPNDLSTMFQDAAGFVPVTGVGQPVALLLDKSKGVVLGSEKVVNSDFDSDTAWTKGVNATISNGCAILNNASGNPTLSQNVGLTAGKWYEVTVNVTEVTSGVILFRVYGTGGSDSIFGIASVGIYKAKVIARSDATGLIGFSASSTSMKISSVSVKELAGNHAYATTSASRPILRQNATTGAYYLAFDGIDDFLRTNSINFTATNKVSLVAGIRKLSDSAFGVVLETGTNYTTPTGGFVLFSSYAVDLVGSGVSGGGVFYTGWHSGYGAPRSLVTSLRLDLSAIDRPTQVKFNIDGARKDIAEGSAAAGIFANTPIFIGMREGKTLPFNGHIYGLIGIGKLASDNETLAIEKELAKQAGVTLNV